MASIRRILNEDEAPKPAPEPYERPPREHPSGGERQSLPTDGILVLDSSMMVENFPPDQPQRKTFPEQPPLEHPPLTPSEPTASQTASPPPPASQPKPPERLGGSLVAPEAAAAAGASVGTLMRALASERSTAVQRGGPTIEDLVRAELRPLLKEWLDQHLPSLVERLVQSEIERVVSRMAS